MWWRRALRWTIIVVAVLGVTLALLPRIVSSGGVRRMVVNGINRKNPQCVVGIADWKWRWWGGCWIEGISYESHAPEKSVTASVGRIAFEHGWWAMFVRQRYGEVAIERPKLATIKSSLVPRPSSLDAHTSTNELRRTKDEKPHSSRKGGHIGPPLQMAVALVRAPHITVTVSDGEIALEKSKISNLKSKISLDGLQGAVTVEATGIAEGGSGMMKFRAEAESLEALLVNPLLAGFSASVEIPPTRLALVEAMLPEAAWRPRLEGGEVALNLSVSRPAGRELSVAAKARAQSLALRGGAFGDGKVIWDYATLSVRGETGLAGTALREFSVETPFGAFRAEGAISHFGGTGKGTLEADADLAKAFKALSPLFAKDAQLSGRGSLSGKWAMGNEGFRIETAAEVSRFAWKASAMARRWETAMLRLDTAATWKGSRVRGQGSGVRGQGTVWRDVDARLDAGFARGRFAAEEMSRDGAVRGLSAYLETDFDMAWEWLGQAALNTGERLVIEAKGDTEKESLDLSRLRVMAGPLDWDGRGTVTAWRGERRLAYQGEFGVDFDRLHKLLKTLGVEGVTLVGRSVKPFSVTVPLGGGRREALASMKGMASVATGKVTALGVTGERAKAEAIVGDGAMAVRGEAAVGDGAFAVAGAVDLINAPMSLSLAPSLDILKDVPLTAALMEASVARSHPVLRQCIVTGGRLSLTLDTFYIPFVPEPQKLMMWEGTAAFDDARLTARGVSLEIIEALRLPRRDMAIADQTIEIAGKGNHLFSPPLLLTLGGHPVRAYGTVSLDGTLEYWVEFPPTEGLVGAARLPSLRHERLRVPLIGTARDPHFDMDALKAEVQRLTR